MDEKRDLRAVIKYFRLKVLTLTETKATIQLESTLSFSKVKNWVAEFTHTRTNKSCSRHQKTVTVPDVTEKVNRIVLHDRRVEMRELEKWLYQMPAYTEF